MQIQNVDPTDYANVITKALRRGALLTTKVGDKVNSMVIGWGHIGRIWERPVFVAYVRKNRYTLEMLDRNPEFTVNVAPEGLDRLALAVCGTKSGRDLDKLAAAGLTPVAPQVVSVPAIRECPLTLECRVIYREEQTFDRLPEEIRRKFYSVEAEDHVCYFGEIVAAYLIGD